MHYTFFALSSLTSLSLLLGLAIGIPAQMFHSDATAQPPGQTNEFLRIEQPLWSKFLITGGGLCLIGLEVWWFLLSQPKTQKTKSSDDFQKG